MISTVNIQHLSQYIQQKIGLYFPQEKYTELNYKLTELAKERGFKNADSFANEILGKANEKEYLDWVSAKLTIGETYFWRDREIFRRLEETIIPNLIRDRQKTKTIRIWSAGCSSGEEPYSIAILLSRLIPDFKNWNIVINATDINQNSLKKALRAVYTDWSFRSAPVWLKQEYFEKINTNAFKLSDKITKMVNFSYLNLFDDVYPSLATNTNAIDLILCRNVLMYFSLEDIKNISNRMYNCLTSDGKLITSPAESFQFLSSKFKFSFMNGMSIFEPRNDHEDLEKLSKDKHAKLWVEDKVVPIIVKSKKLFKANRKAKKTVKAAKKRITTDSKNSKIDDAELCFKEGDYVQCLKIIDSVKEHSVQWKTNLLRARISANQGELQSALMQCNLAISLNKLQAESYFLQGTIEAELGNIDKAYKAISTSVYLDPQFIISHFTLGNLANNMHKFEKAEKHFSNAIDLLDKQNEDAEVPASGGILVKRMKEIVKAMI